MQLPVEWLLPACAVGISLLVLGITALCFSRSSQGKDATCVPGLPFIGNAIALGRHGAAYIAACQHEFGPVFTLTLAGQRMQFWMEPALVQKFFSAPEEEITFRPAVEQFTQRVFGLPSKTFFPKHSKVLQDLRELLVPSSLADHAAALAAAMERRMDKALPLDTEVDLYTSMRKLVFGAGVETLFGRGATQDENEDLLEEEFYAFESGFELAASPVPHAFQPRFLESRKSLLSWLSRAVKKGALEGTTAGTLLQKADLPSHLAPNLLLAVLWASQANTVAASFWTVALLLLPEHSRWKKDVLSDLGMYEGSTMNTSARTASLSARAAIRALDRRSLISRSSAEAIRLRVQSIDVRMAAADLQVKTKSGRQVKVPKGCILAINPFLMHLDKGVYPDPLTFNPDRVVADLGEGGAVVPAIAGLAFGAGPYRCPGRFFAEMEVALVAQVVLASRHLELSSGPQPPPNPDAGQPQEPSMELDWTHTKVLGTQVMTSLFGADVVTWGFGLNLPTREAVNIPSGTDASTAAGVGQEGTSGDGPVDPDWWLHHCGDPERRLPKLNLQRLVGVKAPVTPCWVMVSKVPQTTLEHSN